VGSVLEILLLQALACHAQGDIPRALHPLERALTLAKPQGYVRIFVDEGLPMAQLLSEAAARGILPDYAAKLLAAFSPGGPEQVSPAKTHSAVPNPQSVFIEPLSERELEVLGLIAEGLTNKEIAARLYISLNTVKVHTRNINGKLGVNSRIQAAVKARALGILPST
jgi:LuxR family maltose regulon positive regulatory protein